MIILKKNILDEYLDQELEQEIHDRYIVLNDDQWLDVRSKEKFCDFHFGKVMFT